MTMEAMKGLGQRNRKDTIKDCFISDGYFALKRPYEYIIYVVYDIIDISKTNTKIFCKDTIKNITKG